MFQGELDVAECLHQRYDIQLGTAGCREDVFNIPTGITVTSSDRRETSAEREHVLILQQNSSGTKLTYQREKTLQVTHLWRRSFEIEMNEPLFRDVRFLGVEVNVRNSHLVRTLLVVTVVLRRRLPSRCRQLHSGPLHLPIELFQSRLPRRQLFTGGLVLWYTRP
ncbi:hypothetical protein L798_02161 [Zootermopsis nevadensis]|uniref:Uncharacterized protein n=1 Tax=Zootermopsis nevadensis TaxID=136037 RepID=A0A067RGL6_ZOONE|nr:hypothetical protein L798_02161 [Zootermopsis nevadensis]